jgi:DNA-binding transcriptional MocR family regulator
MTNQDRIEKAYVENYNAAIVALQAIERAIHDMHAPESGYVTWTRVGDMGRLASDLEATLDYLPTP